MVAKNTQAVSPDFPREVAELIKPKTAKDGKCVRQAHIVFPLMDDFPFFLAVENHPHADEDAVQKLAVVAGLAFTKAWEMVPDAGRVLVLEHFSHDWKHLGDKTTPERSMGRKRAALPWACIRVITSISGMFVVRDETFLQGHWIYVPASEFMPGVEHGFENVVGKLVKCFGEAAKRMLPDAPHGESWNWVDRILAPGPLSCRYGKLGSLWIDDELRAEWLKEERIRAERVELIMRLLPEQTTHTHRRARKACAA